jgi:hypothetical protein
MAHHRRHLDRAPIAVQDLGGGTEARAGSFGAVGAHEDSTGTQHLAESGFTASSSTARGDPALEILKASPSRAGADPSVA